MIIHLRFLGPSHFYINNCHIFLDFKKYNKRILDRRCTVFCWSMFCTLSDSYNVEQDIRNSKTHLVFVLLRHHFIKVERRALLKLYKDAGALTQAATPSLKITLCPLKAPERGFSLNIKPLAIKKTSNPALGSACGWRRGFTGAEGGTGAKGWYRASGWD